jgi:hypothetical protein
MSNKLPFSRVVTASVNLTPAGAQAQSLSNCLLLGTSTIIDPVERFRTYSSLAAVAADFGTTVEEYLGAVAWFAQVPQPTSLIIGRWVNAASKGGLRCAPLSATQQLLATWQAITTGAFKISKDGASAVDVTGLNFSGAANLAAVAALIQAGTGMPAGVTVVWNSVYSRFEFTSNTTGTSSAISFLTAPGSGTAIGSMLGGLSTSSGAYVFAGLGAETALAAVAIFDDIAGQRWYGLVVPSAVDADHQAIALYIEASGNKHVYGVNTQSAGVIVAATTSDIASVLKALNVRRTMVQYSSTSAYAILSALARILTTDYEGSATVITLKFKNEPGTTAELLSTTQANAAEGKNANLFVAYDNGTNIIEQGLMCDGTFTDVLMSTDWLAITIQRDIFNLLVTSTTKIPQTDQGVHILITACEARCSQGVVNGMIAPGVWNANGFGTLTQGDYLQKGYYVYAPSVNAQSQSDRNLRKAPTIQVAVKLAGAIHSADVLINVNQ